jgi:hypothetical protein
MGRGLSAGLLLCLGAVLGHAVTVAALATGLATFAAAFGTAVTVATLATGLATFAIAAAAVAVHGLVQTDGLETELGGHLLDDGLLQEIEHGLDAEDEVDRHQQRGRHQDQEEKSKGLHGSVFRKWIGGTDGLNVVLVVLVDAEIASWFDEPSSPWTRKNSGRGARCWTLSRVSGFGSVGDPGNDFRESKPTP